MWNSKDQLGSGAGGTVYVGYHKVGGAGDGVGGAGCGTGHKLFLSFCVPG